MTYYLYRNGLVFFRMDYASTMALLFLYAVVVAAIFALRPLLNMFGGRAAPR
jgi:multiple sugar transport system permease protein